MCTTRTQRAQRRTQRTAHTQGTARGQRAQRTQRTPPPFEPRGMCLAGGATVVQPAHEALLQVAPRARCHRRPRRPQAQDHQGADGARQGDAPAPSLGRRLGCAPTTQTERGYCGESAPPTPCRQRPRLQPSAPCTYPGRYPRACAGLLLTRPNSFQPAIDIIRTEKSYTIYMDVPGLTKHDVTRPPTPHTRTLPHYLAHARTRPHTPAHARTRPHTPAHTRTTPRSRALSLK